MQTTNSGQGQLTLDALITAIRQEARRRGDTESAPGASPLYRTGSSRTQRSFSSQVRIVSGSHIREFLPLYGEEFLIVAYQTLLGRSLDPSGAQHYVGALLTGRVSRWELLARLRLSPEGRIKRTRLRGLWLACFASLVYRLPIIGFIATLFARILALPPWLQLQISQEMLLSHVERRLD